MGDDKTTKSTHKSWGRGRGRGLRPERPVGSIGTNQVVNDRQSDCRGSSEQSTPRDSCQNPENKNEYLSVTANPTSVEKKANERAAEINESTGPTTKPVYKGWGRGRGRRPYKQPAGGNTTCRHSTDLNISGCSSCKFSDEGNFPDCSCPNIENSKTLQGCSSITSTLNTVKVVVSKNSEQITFGESKATQHIEKGWGRGRGFKPMEKSIDSIVKCKSPTDLYEVDSQHFKRSSASNAPKGSLTAVRTNEEACTSNSSDPNSIEEKENDNFQQKNTLNTTKSVNGCRSRGRGRKLSGEPFSGVGTKKTPNDLSGSQRHSSSKNNREEKLAKDSCSGSRNPATIDVSRPKKMSAIQARMEAVRNETCKRFSRSHLMQNSNVGTVEISYQGKAIQIQPCRDEL